MRAKINIIVFLLSLAAAFVVGIVIPADEESILEENRTRAEFPALTRESFFSGEFSRNFENYLADSVGFRSFFTSQSAAFTTAKGIDLGLGKIMEVNKDLGTGDTGEKKKLLVRKEKIEEVFEFDQAAADAYIETLNDYAQALPADVNLYVMLVPTQIEFEEPLYQSVGDSQQAAIQYIYGKADERIKTVDAYSAMAAHQDEYIYFRTDHHWTQLGAFWAFNAFLEAQGETPPALSSYEKNSYPNFFGTLYQQAGKPDIAPDTIEYYTKGENLSAQAFGYLDDGSPVEYGAKLYWTPAEGEQASYKVFLCGDHSLLDIPTETKNGRSILIVKDSYANAFAPWLTEYYEHILLVDPRSYREGIETILDQYGPEDVLIMNYTLSTTFPDVIQDIRELGTR